MAPVITVIAAGSMGGGVGQRLREAGCSILTHLQGRSEQTCKRAREAGMADASFQEIIEESDFILSIVPPQNALALAEKIAQEVGVTCRKASGRLIYADCNAVSVTTVKRISQVFQGLDVAFVDASIIGGPPAGGYNPVFYGSADAENKEALVSFVGLSAWGLRTKALDGEGARVGDASALKMAYAGISKGVTGLMTTMILAAQAYSPATAEALISELGESRAGQLRQLTVQVPRMVPKAYRWVREMHEVAAFVGEDGGEIYRGIASVYERVERSRKGDGRDIDVLEQFVSEAVKRL